MGAAERSPGWGGGGGGGSDAGVLCGLLWERCGSGSRVRRTRVCVWGHGGVCLYVIPSAAFQVRKHCSLGFVAGNLAAEGAASLCQSRCAAAVLVSGTWS